MKEITREWLVAFHAQQCLEKALKAILEEKNVSILKSHDLIRINNLAKEYILLPDLYTLKFLNELYVDSRYPGDLGLLPNGKPSFKEANLLVEYAELVFRMIFNYLESNSI